MNGVSGPISYENWKAWLSNNDSLGGYEVPLFTDAHVTGEILELGPYQLLNTIAIPRLPGSITPSVILRVEDYLETSPSSYEEMTHTNDTFYHGGLLYDEIAALTSLILGVRFKSGGITRLFDKGKDPRGKPVHYEIDKNPVLLKREGKLIIPNACRTVRLEDLGHLLTYPTLTQEDATALIKVARIYQDALWIVESEPELAWIMFVSAIETAANHWSKAEVTPVEKLHTSRPDLEKVLYDEGGDDLVIKIAELIVPYMGATRKFIDFVLKFLPPEPMNRPEKPLQHPWEINKIKKTLGKIYEYRSDALHGGRTFPAPMCMPPMIFHDVPSEIPFWLAAKVKGGIWMKEDTPILLHTFEYIVRGVLLRWWAESLVSKK